jgi:iron-sulfur cluster assembly protein
MTINITQPAREELLRLAKPPERFLRLSVEQGGCSGMLYRASIDTEFGEDDEVLFDDGQVRVVVDRFSAYFLTGVVVDYSDDLVRSGFRITSDSAENSCGCGGSFGV